MFRRYPIVSLNPRSPARPSDIVHIASLLVQATPQGIAIAKHAAAALPGAEIYDTAASGKFVVVLESARERAIADAADTLSQVTGVLTVSVIAHLMEPADDLEQEI